MVSMSDELKEHNILKLIFIVKFACAILDVGHPRLVSLRRVSQRNARNPNIQVKPILLPDLIDLSCIWQFLSQMTIVTE
jgi:hypothetical protein